MHDLHLAHVLLCKHDAVPVLLVHAARQTPDRSVHRQSVHLFAVVDVIDNLIEFVAWEDILKSPEDSNLLGKFLYQSQNICISIQMNFPSVRVVDQEFQELLIFRFYLLFSTDCQAFSWSSKFACSIGF